MVWEAQNPRGRSFSFMTGFQGSGQTAGGTSKPVRDMSGWTSRDAQPHGLKSVHAGSVSSVAVPGEDFCSSSKTSFFSYFTISETKLPLTNLVSSVSHSVVSNSLQPQGQ